MPAVTAASPQLILGLMLTGFNAGADSAEILLLCSSTFMLSNASFILVIEFEKSALFTVNTTMPPSPPQVAASKNCAFKPRTYLLTYEYIPVPFLTQEMRSNNFNRKYPVHNAQFRAMGWYCPRCRFLDIPIQFAGLFDSVFPILLQIVNLYASVRQADKEKLVVQPFEITF